jgi:hypothetical protein
MRAEIGKFVKIISLYSNFNEVWVRRFILAYHSPPFKMKLHTSPWRVRNVRSGSVRQLSGWIIQGVAVGWLNCSAPRRQQ